MYTISALRQLVREGALLWPLAFTGPSIPRMDWPLTQAEEDALCEAAIAAREKAYAPYSDFHVGAALLTETGVTFPGCNIENASFGLCLCAERTSVGTAMVAGHNQFKCVAIATTTSPPSPPCGMCRQVLAEFNPKLPIVLVNLKGERQRLVLSEIFPGIFDGDFLRSVERKGQAPESDGEP